MYKGKRKHVDKIVFELLILYPSFFSLYTYNKTQQVPCLKKTLCVCYKCSVFGV